MTSKYQFTNSSLYISGTDIPRNRLNITDPNEIHELERMLLEEAYQVFYSELNEETMFNEDYYRSLHKRTFESLYEWAGIYRTHNMSKGDSRFCQGLFVEENSISIFNKLKNDNFLKDYSEREINEFSKVISYYQGELIALHPFYELNGRITRLFFDMISVYNGYNFIDYSVVTPDEYIDASIECVRRAKTEKLEIIITKGLSKAL